MKFTLLGSVATAALVCAAPLAMAQTPERQDQSTPAMKSESQGHTPGKAEHGSSKAQANPGTSQRSEGAKQDHTRTAQPGSEPQDKPAGKTAKEHDQSQPKSAQKGSEKGSDRTTAQQSQPKGKEHNKSAEQPAEKSKSKSAQERSGKEPSKQVEQPGDRSKDRSKAAQDQKGAKQPKSAADESRSGQEKRVQVTEEKRTGVRDRLLKSTKVDRTKINVSARVGIAIPRSVHLHTLPATLITFAPAYRGYDYVVLEDETILIVNPRSYVIVDVLPAGTQRAARPARAQLALSAADMRFVYRQVPKSSRSDVRVRLALGANVPSDVALLAFPSDVVDHLPDLRGYRFIVSGDDVVIVDPDSRDVALVISE